MNLTHRLKDTEAITKIDFVAMLLEQVLHHHVMGSATHDANVTLLAKRQNFVVVGDKFCGLAGVTKTGQTVCGDAGSIVLQDGNNGRHVKFLVDAQGETQIFAKLANIAHATGFTLLHGG